MLARLSYTAGLLLSTGVLSLFSSPLVRGAEIFTMTPEWKHGEPVIITGSELRGDLPDSKRLCIAPQADPSKKKCYAEADLPIPTWSDSSITFYPFEDTPSYGVVTLKLIVEENICFAVDGCEIRNQNVERSIGDFLTLPTIDAVTDITDESNPQPARSIEPWKVYRVDGFFFGDTEGDVFLRQQRGTKQIPYSKIYTWTRNSVVFASPSDAEKASGVSIRSKSAAQWYDFPSSGTSSVGSSGSDPLLEKIRNMQVIGVLNVFNMLRASQDTVNRLRTAVMKVNSSSGAECRDLSYKDNLSACTSYCSQVTQKTCEALCEDKRQNSFCMVACNSYKELLDKEEMCVSSCLKMCEPGKECVCTEGKANRSATREYSDAKQTLVAGYRLLNEETSTEDTLKQDLNWLIETNDLKFVNMGGAVSLMPTHDGGVTDGTLFTDVSDNDPYIAAIRWAKENGIIQGYPDGTFRPDATVNRAEFLKLVFSTKRVNVDDEGGESGFWDLDEKAWYAPFVRFAKKTALIQGYPDGSFKPEREVNAAEALKMAYIAFGIPGNPVSGGAWYETYLKHAKEHSVLFSNSMNIAKDMSRKDTVWILWKLSSL